MATITLRNTKGSPLTNQELDDNFSNLNTEVGTKFDKTGSFYIGTTGISIDRASATQTLTGISIDGNAGTVTNGVYTSGSYTDPNWLTLSKSKVGLGNVENTALSTWSGSTSITTIGAATATSLTVTGNLTANGSTTDIKGTLRLYGSTSGYVGLVAASNAGNITYTLPASDGLNGNVLATNGSGTLQWVTQSTGGGSGGGGSGTSTSRTAVVATSGQTTFNVNYTVGQIDVYLNGVKLVIGTEVTCTSGTNIVLATGAAAGDVLETVVYSSQWLTSLNDLYYTTGNVGIGISTPGSRLEVGSNTTSELRISSTGSFGAGQLSFYSDRGTASEWRPGYIISNTSGSYTGSLDFYTNGTGSGNKTGSVLGLSVSNAVVTIPGTTSSTLYTNGALVVGGGMGIAGRITTNDIIARTTANGNAAWLQQDGTGRNHWYWNTYGGTTPTYTNAGEDASALSLTVTNTGAGGVFFHRSASGVGKLAGDAITWITTLYSDLNTFTWKGNTVLRSDNYNTYASPLAGSTSITTLGTVTTGTWNGGVISSTYGGTGINNAGRTLAINTNSGTITFSNASTTLTVANNSSVSGTNTGDQTTITGNAGTATTWQTARTLTVGATGKTVDGSANVTWSRSEVIGNSPASGAWFSNSPPIVGSDGVMEVGRYIDFHSSSAGTTDFDVRLDCSGTNAITFGGSTTVTAGTFVGALTGNASTVTNGFYTTSSFNLGTTSIAVNRASASQSLTGISIDGNAGTVTNGVYTTGTQTIGGSKTFSSDVTLPQSTHLVVTSTSSARYYIGNDGTNFYINRHNSSGTYQNTVLFSPNSAGDLYAGVQGLLLGVNNYTSYAPIVGNTSTNNLNTVYTSGLYGFEIPSANGPGFSYGHMLVMKQRNDTIAQLAIDYNTGTMAYRGAYLPNGNSTVGAVWSSWRTALDSTNYNSYSPTLTGGGASGTWGISITGNAATVGTLSVHSGRNNEANKVVRTDGSGYLQVGYINSSSGNEGNNSSPARVWGTNGSDDYLRSYLTSALSVGNAAQLNSIAASRYFRSTNTILNSNTNWNTIGNTVNTSTTVYTGAFNQGGGTGSSNFPTNAAYTYGVVANIDGGTTEGRAQIYVSHAGNDLIFRGGWGDNSWNTWNRVITDQNHATINVVPSGNNGAAASDATGDMNTLTQKSGFYLYNNPTNAPEATWTTWMTAMGHYSGDRYGWQLAQAYWSDALWTRRVTSNGWYSWRKILDSGNYNSYSPTLTGGNASGTWGISISGSLTGTAPNLGYSISGATISYQAQGGPQVYGNGGGASMITFHRPGSYAVNFGLDTDNQLKVGGWSMGGVSYTVLHSGNASSYVSGTPALNVVTGTTQTAAANNHYVLTNGSATTVTLPTSPAAGDIVWITVANGLTTNVVARNGQNIQSIAEDMTLNTPYASVQMRYINATIGWILV